MDVEKGEPIEILTDKIELDSLFMGFDRYSQAIINIINGTDSNFSIGVYGEWGSGKTTMMHQIEDKLKNDGDILTVWFNAWRYERENQFAIVSLLKTIAYEMDKSPKYDKIRQIILKSIATIAKGVIEKYFFTEKTTTELRKNFVSDMKKLVEEDKDTIYFDGIRNIENALNEIRKEFSNQKIVVFIDDLDRCSPLRALEVFESIKVFLDLDGFVYIIGLSHETISKLVSAAYNQTEINGEHYIRKIIQIPILIPEWNTNDIESFIENILSKKLNNKYSSLIKQNKKLISLAVESNPREVKRFINNFIVSHEIFSSNPDVKTDHLLVAQTMRARWPNFYKHFSSNETFRKLTLDLLNFSYDSMINLFDRSLFEHLLEKMNEDIKNIQHQRSVSENKQIVNLDSQTEEIKKKIDFLKEKYEEINKLYDEQRKSIEIRDQKFWMFLDKNKEILINIKDWEIYRRAIKTTKEINPIDPDKEFKYNHLITHNLIRINPEPLLGKNSGFILDMNYYWYKTIQELLDSIWSSLLFKFGIPPYRYINTWLLQDSKTGRIFDDIGIGSQYGSNEDDRYVEDKQALKDVGINPGMELLIIPGYDT